MPRLSGLNGKYTTIALAAAANPRPHRLTGRDACGLKRNGVERTKTMLDIAYILLGAAFLGACVLYAYACDRL